MDINLIASILAVIVGFCALGVSVCALGVSLWQGYETWTNYRLSVTPHIDIYIDWKSKNQDNGIFLVNNGLGPAKIQRIVINYLGEEINYMKQLDKFISFIKTNFPPEISTSITGTGFQSGCFLPAGVKSQLLSFRVVNEEQAEEFGKALYGISFSINYSSIYGKSFDFNSTLEIPQYIS